MSGLKFNFFKSKLYGVHVKDKFLMVVSNFLSFIIDAIPFKLLGVLVGSNPRRYVTWNPLIKYMKRELSIWKCRNLSIEGRVLLNLVLSSLLVFLMSFYKVPKKVIKDILLL